MWNYQKRPYGVLILVLILLGAACTSGSEDTSDGSSGSSPDGSSTTAAGASGDGSASEAVSTFEPLIDTSLITDPVEHDLVFACNAMIASAEQLDAALEAASPTEIELDNRLSQQQGPDEEFVFVGNASSFGQLPTGWIIDRDPLTSTPASFSVISPDGTNIPCAFRRAGFFKTRPVAWKLADDGRVTIEACVDPADVVVDLRQIDGRDVLTLFGPYDDTEPGTAPAQCAVNGAVSLELDQVEVGDDVLSGLTYPFQPPDPLTFQLLGFGSTVADLEVPLVDELSCRAIDGDSEVSVTWTTLPAGLSATVSSEGDTLFRAAPLRFEESALTAAAYDERRAAYGFAIDPVPVDQHFGDVLAPNTSQREYQLVIGGQGIEPITLGCGSAGISGLGTGPTTVELPGGDLGVAAALFQSAAVGPYGYMTVVALCDGCSSTPFQIQLAPGGEFGHDFSPSLNEQTGGKFGGILNPFAIHHLLDQAEAEGKNVSYQIDSLAGIPSTWMIDGVGARILCFEVDVAPPELRDGALCNPDWDLMTGP